MAEMVNLESSDTAKDNIERLKEIFPDIVRDGEVDFKALQLLLGEEIATDNESYKFEWVGKKNCYKSIQTPSNGTLKYVKEDSLNPDTSENLIIEGDNLEVLKLLQSSYKNSIKMIYIDPPYNTGNDFVYPDNFSNSPFVMRIVISSSMMTVAAPVVSKIVRYNFSDMDSLS